MKKKTRNIIILSSFVGVVVLLFATGIVKLPFFSVAGQLYSDVVAFQSSGPDLKCSSPDDTNVYIQDEVGCGIIQLNPPTVFDSFSHPSTPRLLASGYAYDPTLRSFNCQTPPRILELQGKTNLNGVWQPSQTQFVEGGFSTYEAFGQAYSDYYQCGPFFILNDKIYKNEPFTVIDNKITQAKLEVYYTVCKDASPQSSNRQYGCELGYRTGITALEFDILPKKTEGFCTSQQDCIDILCVEGTPEAECRNYACINNQCQLNVPTSSVFTTSILPGTSTTSTSVITTTIFGQPSTTTTIIECAFYSVADECRQATGNLSILWILLIATGFGTAIYFIVRKNK